MDTYHGIKISDIPLEEVPNSSLVEFGEPCALEPHLASFWYKPHFWPS